MNNSIENFEDKFDEDLPEDRQIAVCKFCDREIWYDGGELIGLRPHVVKIKKGVGYICLNCLPG